MERTLLCYEGRRVAVSANAALCWGRRIFKTRSKNLLLFREQLVQFFLHLTFDWKQLCCVVAFDPTCFGLELLRQLGAFRRTRIRGARIVVCCRSETEDPRGEPWKQTSCILTETKGFRTTRSAEPEKKKLWQVKKNTLVCPCWQQCSMFQNKPKTRESKAVCFREDSKQYSLFKFVNDFLVSY